MTTTSFQFLIILLGYIFGILEASSDSLIPDETCSKFGTYPNIFNVTQLERDLYHPVVIYPKHRRPIAVKDDTNAQGLATIEEIALSKGNKRKKGIRRALQQIVELITFRRLVLNSNSPQWNLGRYDENRVQMYSSDLFVKQDEIPRTVHLGIDLGAPAGTSVYAFTDGIVHSSGYNSAYGDYGHVIIIEHLLASRVSVFALYGHLSSVPELPKAKTRIRKGQRIGRIGDCHENGGWIHPHLHFQLSVEPPSTPHDMPGACSLDNRPQALLRYPDPRYILGELY